MEKLSLYFSDETAFSSDGFSVLPGPLASFPSEALVECSQPCRATCMLSRYDSMYLCGLSVMDVGAFSSILLQIVLLLPRGGENVSERHWTVE